MLNRLAAALLALLCLPAAAHAACNVPNPPPFTTSPNLATMTSEFARITGGCIDGTPIGENNPSTGNFTNLTVGGIDIGAAIGAVSDFNFAAGANVGVARDGAAWDYNAGGVAVEFAANTPALPTFDPARPTVARGWGIFGASSNLFLNSASPATQTITLAAGTYTLQADGAGHVYTAFSGQPDAANTGDGTSTVVTPLIGAQPGVYTATATSSSSFTVTDPGSNVVGTATARDAGSAQALAPNFADQIMFAITSGATPFVAGDKFYFEIGAGGAAGPRMPHTFTITRDQPVEFRVRGAPSRVWLTQSPIEQPYVASEGSAGSRGGDVAAASLGGWTGSASGTAVAVFRVESLSSLSSDRTIIQIDDGTAANRVTMRIDSATRTPTVDFVVGGVLRASISTEAIYPRTAYSMAATWTPTTAAVALNGTVYGASTTLAAAPPVMSNLRFGAGLAGADPLDGYLLRVTAAPLASGSTSLAQATTRRSVVRPVADHGCAWDGSTDDADCLNAAFADAGANALPLIWPCGTAFFNEQLVAPEGLVTFAGANCGSRPVLKVGPGMDAWTHAIKITAGTGGKFWWSGVTIDGSAGTYAPPYLSEPVTLAAINPATSNLRNPDYLKRKDMFQGSGLQNPVWYDWGAHDFGSFGIFIDGSPSTMIGRGTLARMGYDNYSSGSMLLVHTGSRRPIYDVIAGNPCKLKLAQRTTDGFGNQTALGTVGGQLYVRGLSDGGVSIPAGPYTVTEVAGESVHQPVLSINYDCSGVGPYTFNGHGYVSTLAYVSMTNALITNVTASDMTRGNLQMSAETSSFVYSTLDGGHEAWGFVPSSVDYLQAFTASRNVEIGDIVASGISENNVSADLTYLSNYAADAEENCVIEVGAWNSLHQGNYCLRSGVATKYAYGPFGERYYPWPIGVGNGSVTTFAAGLNSIPPSGGLVIVAGSARARDVDGSGILVGPGVSSGSIDYATGSVTVTFTAPVAAGVQVQAYYPGVTSPPVSNTPLPLFRRAPYALTTGPGYPSSTVVDSNTLVDDRSPAVTNYAFVAARSSLYGLFKSLTMTNNDLSGLNAQTASFLPLADPYNTQPDVIVDTNNLLPTIIPPPPPPTADLELEFKTAMPAEVTYTRAGSVYAIGSDGKTPQLFTADMPPRPAYDQSGVNQGLGCYPQSSGSSQMVANALTPATQTIALPAGPYVASALGNGQFTISGAINAIVGPGENYYFAMPAAGSVTVTPTGSLTYMSIETGHVRTEPKTSTNAVSQTSAEITGTTYSTKGAVYLELTPVDISTSDDVSRTLWLLDDGTVNNQVWIFLRGVDHLLTFRITQGGLTSPVNIQTPYPQAGFTTKIFASWDTTTGEASLAVNGRQVGTTSGISAWPVGLAHEWACNPPTRGGSPSNHDIAVIKRWWTTLPSILQGEFMTQ